MRLLVPSVAFTVLLTPPIEFVDSSNAWFHGSFWEFLPYAWLPLPPPPGPTWFLGILLVFSFGYAALRRHPPRPRPGGRLTGRHLLVTVAAVAASAYSAGAFLDRRIHRRVLAGERGWLDQLDAQLLRVVRRVAWLAVAAMAGLVATLVSAGGGEAAFGGGGSWESLVFAVLEATVMVTVSVWLIDVFRRRVVYRGAAARELARSSYAAFFVHQGILVAIILASRHFAWPPEVKFFSVAILGVALSFGLGALLRRLPGISRVL